MYGTNLANKASIAADLSTCGAGAVAGVERLQTLGEGLLNELDMLIETFGHANKRASQVLDRIHGPIPCDPEKNDPYLDQPILAAQISARLLKLRRLTQDAHSNADRVEKIA